MSWPPARRLQTGAALAVMGGLALLGCGSGGEPQPDASENPGLSLEDVAGFSPCKVLERAAGPPPTSLVLVVNDSMRQDRVGVYGGGAATPNLDAFARAHLLFRNAVAPAPWTKASIASLFTATYPSQHGVLSHQIAWGTAVLGSEFETLAEVLAGARFRTAAFVSNPWMSRGLGFEQGFETYEDSFARFDAPGSLVTEAALEWLSSLDEGEPYFLYVHYIDSHLPYGALSPERIAAARERLEADKRPVPDEAREYLKLLRSSDGAPLLSSDGSPPPVRALLEMAYERGIEIFDQEFGALLRALEARSEWERTAVVVTSDHGESFFERGWGSHGRSLFDQELAIPLAMRLPGTRSAQGEIDCPVSLVDLMATFCDSFALTCPTSSGVSLFRGAEGEAIEPPRYVVSEGVLLRPRQRAIRNQRYKLIFAPGGPNLEGGVGAKAYERHRRYALYDLEQDPLEEHDLLRGSRKSESLRNVLSELKDALHAAVPASDRAPPQLAPVDPEIKQRLGELGYLDEGE